MAIQQSINEPARPGHPGRWATLSALGIVFGDLGTSPLYCLQTVVQATGGQFNSHNESLGMLFPFTLAWLLVILLVAFVPDLVLWLPRMMQGHN